MKACGVFIFVLFTIAAYSQNTINNYKYVLVPERFDFARENNQYGLNSTTKWLLEQKGFVAIMGNGELPPAVAANKCNALKVEVTERKALFTTNLTLVLKDCQGNIIFKGKEGRSREKEFPVAYDGALKDAFVSLNSVPYKYDSTILTPTQQVAAAPAVASPASTPASTPVSAPASSSVADITGTLYAQVIPNGYQLIDTTPKKVVTLLKTSTEDYYIAEAGASNGVVFKKNGEWVFEYYKDNKLVSQKLAIKF
jgi:hypothetical protein